MERHWKIGFSAFQTHTVKFIALPFLISKTQNILSLHVMVEHGRRRYLQKNVLHVQRCKPYETYQKPEVPIDIFVVLSTALELVSGSLIWRDLFNFIPQVSTGAPGEKAESSFWRIKVRQIKEICYTFKVVINSFISISSDKYRCNSLN